MSTDLQKQIHEQVTGHPVVIYMKGTLQFPMCGFSARAVQTLKMGGAREIFGVNVVGDDNLRDALKEYANWPTLPQIYINGEFIGGCDIVVELYQEGELQKLLAAATAPAA